MSRSLLCKTTKLGSYKRDAMMELSVTNKQRQFYKLH